MSESEARPRSLTDDDIVTERVYGRRRPVEALGLVVLAGSEGVLETDHDGESENEA
jgi:hypothetical protein